MREVKSRFIELTNQENGLDLTNGAKYSVTFDPKYMSDNKFNQSESVELSTLFLTSTTVISTTVITTVE